MDEIITREERIFGLATVHQSVKQHFAYLERFTEASWDKAFVEYLPLVERKQNLYDYYRVLKRFIAMLEDGHTNVHFPPSIKDSLDHLPIRLDVVEGEWVVVQRFPTEDVLTEDIPPGSILESIEVESPSEYFAREFYPYLAAGRQQSKRTILELAPMYRRDMKLRMRFRYPDCSSHDRDVTANRSTVQWTEKLSQKYLPAWTRGERLLSTELAPGIHYLSFPSCEPENETRLIGILESWSSKWPNGVILDIRHNGGGSTPEELVRHLISSPTKGYTVLSRWSISYVTACFQWIESADKRMQLLKDFGLCNHFSPEWYLSDGGETVITPAEIHYDGPLAILTGPMTINAAEDLVVLLKQAGRGTVIGDRTFGSTGQPYMFTLPGGGRGLVCTVNCRFADGTVFIGVGCEPDIPVTPTIKGIMEGRDEVLDAALDNLQGISPEIKKGDHGVFRG